MPRSGIEATFRAGGSIRGNTVLNSHAAGIHVELTPGATQVIEGNRVTRVGFRAAPAGLERTSVAVRDGIHVVAHGTDTMHTSAVVLRDNRVTSTAGHGIYVDVSGVDVTADEGNSARAPRRRPACVGVTCR